MIRRILNWLRSEPSRWVEPTPAGEPAPRSGLPNLFDRATNVHCITCCAECVMGELLCAKCKKPRKANVQNRAARRPKEAS